ncbi:MAG: hypothetical protein FD147_2356 [Chloroflexi bacterium]|nr:MAG: hypothetical protein FD147_2356 [Chloroflexota bacterium]
MKIRLISVTMVVFLVLSACQPVANLLGSVTSGGKSQEFAYVFEANADPINVTVALDEGQSVEALIPVEGGSLTAKGMDGTTYTLDIPNDALLVETSIRMTPIASLTGLPFGGSESFAVQLEPEGLFFNNFVTLTITPAQEIPIDQQIMFGYQGNGQDVILAPPVVDSREIKILLQHFSGAGVTKGLLSDTEPVRQRIGGDAERRLQSVAAERLGRERQAQLLGSGDESGGMSEFADLFKQYEEEVVKPRIAAAGESCAAGRLALQTLLGFERQKQLLGIESDGMAEVEKLMDTVGMVCVKEEYELCKNDHVIHRMIPVWLGMRRQSQLLGGSDETEAIKLAKELTQKCLTFELIFNSEATFNAGDGDGYTSSVTSTVKIQFNADEIRMRGQAPLVNKAFEFRAAGCAVTSNRGGGTFEAIDLGYTPQNNIPEGELGKVIDFTLPCHSPV